MSECAKVLRDELPYNLHIFVNSVEFIAKVIDTLKLAPEAVKVVCSTSGESRQENQRPAVRPRKEDKLLHLDLLRGVRHLRPRRRYIHRQRRTKGAHAVGYFHALHADMRTHPRFPLQGANRARLFYDQIQQDRNARRVCCGYPADACRRRKLCRRDKLVE